MIDDVDLESWLRQRSESWESIGSEIVFKHSTGEHSILIKRDVWRDDFIAVTNPTLAAFYRDYLGASIGGGILMIGAAVEGGIDLSKGYKVPSLEDIRSIAINLGVKPRFDDDLFMIGYAGMFFYAYSHNVSAGFVRCYDRDFDSIDEDETFLGILENWWQTHLMNRNDRHGEP